MMVALLITALLTLIAVASIAVIADSGLRWWSALGQLQRQLRNSVEYTDMPRVRAYATPYRGSALCKDTKSKRRVAA